MASRLAFTGALGHWRLNCVQKHRACSVALRTWSVGPVEIALTLVCKILDRVRRADGLVFVSSGGASNGPWIRCGYSLGTGGQCK